ncbi:MAG: EAL domain-containing protein [Gammaproteobacteria bacterium]|nr:EAL domain-containing protein [Gammaproteobacteria bacterium]
MEVRFKSPVNGVHDKELQQAIFSRQLELYFQALPQSLLAVVINSAILVWVFWSVVALEFLLGWFVVSMAVVGYRFWDLTRFKRSPPEQHDNEKLYKQMLFGVIASGLTWGFAGYFLFVPHAINYQVMLAFVIAGLSAGAIVNLSSFLETSQSFLLVILLPIIVRLFQEGGFETFQMGLLASLYLLLLAVSSRRIHKTVIDGLYTKLMFERATGKIKEQAYYDELTKLPNRRLLRDRLLQALSRAERSHVRGALLFIDLDHFKRINDSLGHQVGDGLLCQVAERLQSHIRLEDSAGRLSGDEFVVLLTDLEGDEDVVAEQVQFTAEKLRQVIAEPYQVKGHELHVSASIGISLYPADSKNSEDLLKHADHAMYRAKENGRNNIQFFLLHMQEALNKRLQLEQALRKAVDNNEFQLYFQPQVNAQDEIYGAEVLLRWFKDGDQLVSPADFIPVAEETGLIYMVGDWVLNQACSYLQQIEDLPDIDLKYMAVNVSPREFRLKNFADRVESIVDKYGANPRMLEIEVTENVLVDDIEDTVNKMERLRNLGVCFSIDDFGTGYSSLSYLKRLPLDTLKIDRSFIQDVVRDNNDATIVKTITSMAEMLGLNVIAEGVEDEQTLEFLKQNRCKCFQGYLFGRPMPFEEFLQLVRNQQGLKQVAH